MYIQLKYHTGSIKMIREKVYFHPVDMKSSIDNHEKKSGGHRVHISTKIMTLL